MARGGREGARAAGPNTWRDVGDSRQKLKSTSATLTNRNGQKGIVSSFCKSAC
jgi:hypothetical protein